MDKRVGTGNFGTKEKRMKKEKKRKKKAISQFLVVEIPSFLRIIYGVLAVTRVEKDPKWKRESSWGADPMPFLHRHQFNPQAQRQQQQQQHQ